MQTVELKGRSARQMALYGSHTETPQIQMQSLTPSSSSPSFLPSPSPNSQPSVSVPTSLSSQRMMSSSDSNRTFSSGGGVISRPSAQAAPPPPFLWESHKVSFKWKTFFTYFTFHLFYPLSIPFFFMFGGSEILRMTSMTGLHPAQIYFNHILPLLTLLIVATFPNSVSLNTRGISILEGLQPLILFLSHRVMIGMKYASLSDGEYDKLLRAARGERVGEKVDRLSYADVESDDASFADIDAYDDNNDDDNDKDNDTARGSLASFMVPGAASVTAVNNSRRRRKEELKQERASMSANTPSSSSSSSSFSSSPSLSAAQRARSRRGTRVINHDLLATYSNQAQLISSWIEGRKSADFDMTLEYELWACAQRQGANLRSLKFIVPKSRDELRSLIAARNSKNNYVHSSSAPLLPPSLLSSSSSTSSASSGSSVATVVEDVSLLRVWYKFLNKHDYTNTVRTLEFSAFTLCKKIAIACYDKDVDTSVCVKFAFIASLMQAVMPGVIREYFRLMPSTLEDSGLIDYSEYYFFGKTLSEHVHIGAGMVVSFQFGMANLLFFSVALTDVWRLGNMLKYLGKLVRPLSQARNVFFTKPLFRPRSRNDMSDPTLQAARGEGDVDPNKDDVPILDTYIPSNIRAWLYCRLCLGDYGTRLRKRVSLYVGASLLLVFLLLAAQLIAVLQNFNDIMALRRLRSDPLLYQTLFVSVLYGMIFTLLVLLGSRANGFNVIHRKYLLENRLQLNDGVYLTLAQGNSVSGTIPSAADGNKQNPLLSAQQQKQQSQSAYNVNVHNSNVMSSSSSSCNSAQQPQISDEALAEFAATDRVAESMETLETTIETIEMIDESSPVEIVGARADDTFASGLAGSIVSYVLFIVQKIFFNL